MDVPARGGVDKRNPCAQPGPPGPEHALLPSDSINESSTERAEQIAQLFLKVERFQRNHPPHTCTTCWKARGLAQSHLWIEATEQECCSQKKFTAPARS